MSAADPGATLRRLLANGPLTGWPRRPADSALLVRLAAARFEAGREYREGEVNELLREWLAAFCAEHGIDHVTLRRALVDARFLARDRSGALYRQSASVAAELEALRSLDPGALLAEARQAREHRKQESRARGLVP